MSQQQLDLDLYFNQKLDELAEHIVAQNGFIFRGMQHKFKNILDGKLSGFNRRKLKLDPYVTFYRNWVVIGTELTYGSNKPVRIRIGSGSIEKDKIKAFLNSILSSVKREIND